jgi:CDP-paratose 2-epimerase
MKILIFGGCGFLGSNLSVSALEKGYELVVFDNLYRTGSTDNLQWLRGNGLFKFVHGDVRNWNDVNQVVLENKPDVIFHLAGQVAMTTSISNPRLDMEINVIGSFNVLESVRKHCKDTIIVYSSTNKVYGDLEQFRYSETETRYVCTDYKNGFDEKIPLDFHSPYGCSKGAADQYMLDYARIFGLRTVVFRHSSMYGGRQFASFDQGWVGWFCQKAIETRKGVLKDPFTISGNGKQVRDLLHAIDMVSLYYSAIEKIDSSAGESFNVGGGISNSLSLLELFSFLEQTLNINLNYIKLPNRDSDQKVFVADIGKAQKLLGWSPKVTKEEGINKMIAWVESIS